MPKLKNPGDHWPDLSAKVPSGPDGEAVETLRTYFPSLGETRIRAIARAMYAKPKTLPALERVLREHAPDLILD